MHQIISQHKIPQITAYHLRLKKIQHIIRYTRRIKCPDRLTQNLAEKKQQQKILNILLRRMSDPYLQNRQQHINSHDHRQKPQMIPPQNHLSYDILPADPRGIKPPAVHQSIQTGPENIQCRKPQNIVPVQPFDIRLLFRFQKQSPADHHKNRNAKPKQRIIGICNLKPQTVHRQIIPWLCGSMQHDHAETCHHT